MTIPPVEEPTKDKKANGIVPEFYKPVETKKEKEQRKEVKQKQEPSLKNIAGQTAIVWLPSDPPEEIKARRESLMRRAELANRDEGIEIIGRWYATDSWVEALPVLRNDFLLLCRNRYYRLAANEFKLLPKEIQTELLRGLLQSSEIRDILPFLDYLSKNGSIPEDLRTEVAKVLKNEEKSFYSIRNSIHRLQKILGRLQNYVADRFGAYDFEQFRQEIERTNNPELIARYNELVEAFSVCERRLLEVEEMTYSPEELAENLSSAVLALRRVAFEFIKVAEETALLDESVIQALQDTIQQERDNFNKTVAENVRRKYETDGVVLRLDEEAFREINLSLQRLGEPLLSGMFCEENNIRIEFLADLDFLKDSYELNTEQNLLNLNISIRFIYDLLAKVREAEEQKQALLQKIKKEEAEIVEKFLREYIVAMKQFYKRLDKVEKQEKLKKIEICLSSYIAVLSSLREQWNPLVSKNSKIAWFSLLAEDERWKKIAQLLLDYTKSSIT